MNGKRFTIQSPTIYIQKIKTAAELDEIRISINVGGSQFPYLSDEETLTARISDGEAHIIVTQNGFSYRTVASIGDFLVGNLEKEIFMFVNGNGQETLQYADLDKELTEPILVSK